MQDASLKNGRVQEAPLTRTVSSRQIQFAKAQSEGLESESRRSSRSQAALPKFKTPALQKANFVKNLVAKISGSRFGEKAITNLLTWQTLKVMLGNFTSQDFDIFLHIFSVDSLSPQISAILFDHFTGEMTISAILRNTFAKAAQKCVKLQARTIS